MATRRHPASRRALTTGQMSLWPVEAVAPTELPGTGAGAEAASPDGEAASPPTRHRTPSFVCEIPLRVGPTEQRMLAARLEAARALYNACLGEARTRWFLVKQSRAYQHARILPRKTPERAEAFRAARVAHGCTEAALQAYAKDCRHASHWIEGQLDAPVCQHLATRAYRAVLRLALGKAKHVRFKGRHQLDTVEGKSNETGLVWRTDRMVWRGLSLPAYLPGRRTRTDAVLAQGLAARVKYVRLVRRRIGERSRYAAQLICEGKPPQKPEHPLGQGTVGLDLGPSTFAVVADSMARLEPFYAELDPQAAQIRRDERHLDRQRRHAAHRKSLHGCVAHRIVREGNTFLLEKLSYRAWQRAHPTNQPASGGAHGISHVRRQRASVRRIRSSAAGPSAQSKSPDGVTLHA